MAAFRDKLNPKVSMWTIWAWSSDHPNESRESRPSSVRSWLTTTTCALSFAIWATSPWFWANRPSMVLKAIPKTGASEVGLCGIPRTS